MKKENAIEIYVGLLEEGTPTIRLAQAEILGDELYKLLPTENYDPADEVWEFVPGTIVFGQRRIIESGKEILMAVRQPVSKEELLKSHSNARLVSIHVLVRANERITQKTEAIDLGKGFYKLLPTSGYNPASEIWEFSPGSIVKTIKEKDESGREIFLAFDQVREDRMDNHYAQFIAKR